MSASKIEWTDRSDWNPIRGCTRVSPGCGGPGPHGGCYAEAIAARFSDPGQAFHGYAERTSKGGRWTGKVALQEDRLLLPLGWRKPAKVFVSSTSDVFHEALSDEQIDRIFAVMALNPHLTFQVLTKRSARMRAYLKHDSLSVRLGAACINLYNATSIRAFPARKLFSALGNRFAAEDPEYVPLPLRNVWIGVSVEDQQRADERVPDLLASPAAVRFLSCEPLLGPVDLKWSLYLDPADNDHRTAIDCVIAGGESGPNARPMHPDWARSLRDQCQVAGVPFFFKQWGEWMPASEDELLTVPPARRDFLGKGSGEGMIRVGKARAGRLLDGREWSEFPA